MRSGRPEDDSVSCSVTPTLVPGHWVPHWTRISAGGEQAPASLLSPSHTALGSQSVRLRLAFHIVFGICALGLCSEHSYLLGSSLTLLSFFFFFKRKSFIEIWLTSHIIHPFTNIIPWLLVYLKSCVLITSGDFWTFLLQGEGWDHTSWCHPRPSLNPPSTLRPRKSLSITLQPLEISYTRTHTVYNPPCLASFTWLNIFQAHPCLSVY